MKLILTILVLLMTIAIQAQPTLGKRKKPGTTTTVSGPVQTANKTSQVSELTIPDNYISMKLKLSCNNVEKDYYVKQVGHHYILNGDIIVGTDLPKTMSIAINDEDRRWSNATLPLALDASVINNGSMFDTVMAAVKEFNTKTKFCIVQRTNERDFIKLIALPLSDAGGNSWVGRQGGEQVINLNTNADVPTIIHEIMHTIGFYHEQSRSDRDNFITIDLTNVDGKHQHNFQPEELGVPVGNYDTKSIMHYSAFAFAVDTKKPTIVCKTGNTCTNELGMGRSFSSEDIAAIDMYYSNVSRYPCLTRFPGVVVSTVRFPNIVISESDKAQQSFRHRAEYASKNGFAAGFPNFHEAKKGIDIVGGTILIKHGMTIWRDVPLSFLGGVQLNDFAGRMRATQDYAVARGFVGGFPNYFHADNGSGPVCGTFLLGTAASEWRDVPIAELGNPPLEDIGARMRSANDYAYRNGFLGGFPTFYDANYGKGIVCGIILIRKEAGEWRDVVIAAGPR